MNGKTLINKIAKRLAWDGIKAYDTEIVNYIRNRSELALNNLLDEDYRMYVNPSPQRRRSKVSTSTNGKRRLRTLQARAKRP